MANGTNLILLINFKKNLMKTKAKTNALIKPTMKNGKASTEKYCQFFKSEMPLAPNIIGTAMMNVKSDAALWLMLSRTPPAIVDPEREKPGHNPKHWKSPTPNACL